ncbi:hypothetical protein ABK040_009026 [Willaertia magna]
MMASNDSKSFKEFFQDLGIDIKPRNCFPNMKPLGGSSIQLINKELENESHHFQPPKDYLAFCNEIGSGKLGRVHIYGIYERSIGYLFDFRSHTERLQHELQFLIKRSDPKEQLLLLKSGEVDLLHDEKKKEDDENSEEEEEDKEITFSQPRTLMRNYEQTFSQFVVFARDALEETLYYVWKRNNNSNSLNKHEIWLIEYDERESDVRPPILLCKGEDEEEQEGCLKEFIEKICIGNYIHENDLHSVAYYREKNDREEEEEELNGKDCKDCEEEEEEQEIDKVFIPTLAPIAIIEQIEELNQKLLLQVSDSK